MKSIINLTLLTALLYSCGSEIRNDKTVVVEEGTAIESNTPTLLTTNTEEQVSTTQTPPSTKEHIGFWVGYFEPDRAFIKEDITLNVDDGFSWNKANKINISIDEITDTLVVGHSVVAGNDRPFKGTVKQTDANTFEYRVKEPGDDKYDGQFVFRIVGQFLTGKWTAYKDINIKHRKYNLEHRVFKYDANIILEYAKDFVDWTKVRSKIDTVEVEENEFEEWVSSEFASSTKAIYELNASAKLLKKEDIENLSKGDLSIIRNTIYARHGYSFKNQPLRVFFDAQSWYIPVHSNIKSNFTDIEKQNIKLLLRYEKNALEYYDTFGRG